MYQMPLIHSVRLLEKRIEVAEHQNNYTQPWADQRADQPRQTIFSAGVQPVAERELTMNYTSLSNAIQIWERRWQIEEEQRKQRVLIAETSQETFLKRLPRIKLGVSKKSKEKAELQSCCQPSSDY